MAHSGPSRACASFAPTMSVRIFGHFEEFSTFSARRAPCSAPSCTPDSWTNGPSMTWVLWTWVPMVHTPRGPSGATFVRVLAQSECGQFCHFGTCGPNWDCHHAKWHGDLEGQVHGSLHLTPGRSCMEWRIRFPSRRGDILLGAPPNFGSFRAAKMTPFLGPQFHPPVWSIGGPISLCPWEAWTQFQVVHSDEIPRPRLLSCEPLALP